MKKMKRIATLITAGVIVFGLLSACQPKEMQPTTAAPDNKTITQPTTAQAAGDALKLTFYYPVNVGGSAAQIIDQICADFTAENPDIVVEPVYTGNYDDTVTKIQTAISGGNPPDVFISLATQRFTMASTGMAMPLDELIAADGEEGKAYIADFLEGFMEDSYVDGNIYSIPFQRSTMVLYYNKDAFAEVGLDPEKPPTSWDELVDYGKSLTNAERMGVGIALNSGSAQWAFTGFALQNSVDGINLMSEDGKQVYFIYPRERRSPAILAGPPK